MNIGGLGPVISWPQRNLAAANPPPDEPPPRFWRGVGFALLITGVLLGAVALLWTVFSRGLP